MRRGEKDAFVFPSIGHQILEPSIGHQALEPSIGCQTLEPSISHQNLGSSFISLFFFLFKTVNLDNFGFYFLDIIFDFASSKTCSYNFP